LRCVRFRSSPHHPPTLGFATHFSFCCFTRTCFLATPAHAFRPLVPRYLSPSVTHVCSICLVYLCLCRDFWFRRCVSFRVWFVGATIAMCSLSFVTPPPFRTGFRHAFLLLLFHSHLLSRHTHSRVSAARPPVPFAFGHARVFYLSSLPLPVSRLLVSSLRFLSCLVRWCNYCDVFASVRLPTTIPHWVSPRISPSVVSLALAFSPHPLKRFDRSSSGTSRLLSRACVLSV